MHAAYGQSNDRRSDVHEYRVGPRPLSHLEFTVSAAPQESREQGAWHYIVNNICSRISNLDNG